MTTPRATPIRVGVLGAGGMAREHLTSWQRLGIPVVAYSPSGRAAALAPQFDAVAVDSIEALLGSATVVDICTPTETHRDLATRAIDAGAHVICEKPLALDRRDAIAIVTAARIAGVQIHIAHVVRYFEAYALARKQVAEGRIGRLTALHLSRSGPAPAADWFHDTARSGGVLTDQMIHDFDFARWVGGEITSVEASLERGDGNVVMADATLHHAAGAISQLRGGWLAADTVFTAEFSLRGTAGELSYSSTDGALHLTGADDANRTWDTSRDLPYDTQLADFVSAIRGGSTPRVTPDDALAAVDLTTCARRSAAIGQAVRLPTVR